MIMLKFMGIVQSMTSPGSIITGSLMGTRALRLGGARWEDGCGKSGAVRCRWRRARQGEDDAGVAMTTIHTYAIVHFETGHIVTYSTVSELNIDSASETLML